MFGRVLAAALARARDNGELCPDRDPADVAAALIDAFRGALARARVYEQSQPLDLFFATTAEWLTRAG
ncbi:TetR family transcriptional regulator C-terminal domain-containing protein [Mycobacterium sp. E796]|uniref:TetR family transcriptional regulator C-terminal domain-containing protein n=1 Tax=Mycobacterium sp. E796 TaxID=1834151 RepID=UPI0007FBA43C|nr:TetR family transcriptional regulator C-terminal domain-containing protein [Mycobacterium sp. E796]OBI69745.1 hypothetical protein A5706_10315 [Mycobacterium sp. E796]